MLRRANRLYIRAKLCASASETEFCQRGRIWPIGTLANGASTGLSFIWWENQVSRALAVSGRKVYSFGWPMQTRTGRLPERMGFQNSASGDTGRRNNDMAATASTARTTRMNKRIGTPGDRRWRGAAFGTAEKTGMGAATGSGDALIS